MLRLAAKETRLTDLTFECPVERRPQKQLRVVLLQRGAECVERARSLGAQDVHQGVDPLSLGLLMVDRFLILTVEH